MEPVLLLLTGDLEGYFFRLAGLLEPEEGRNTCSSVTSKPRGQCPLSATPTT